MKLRQHDGVILVEPEYETLDEVAEELRREAEKAEEVPTGDRQC